MDPVTVVPEYRRGESREEERGREAEGEGEEGGSEEGRQLRVTRRWRIPEDPRGLRT